MSIGERSDVNTRPQLCKLSTPADDRVALRPIDHDINVTSKELVTELLADHDWLDASVD